MRRRTTCLSLLTALALTPALTYAASDAPAGPVAAAQAQIAEHGYSARRLHTLGEAQRADGELGAAIASFERATLLEPRDTALRESLRAARSEAGVVGAPDPIAVRLAHVLSLREWATLLLLSALLSAGALLTLALRRRRNASALVLGLGVLLSSVSLAGFAVVRGKLHQAIVLHDGAVLRRSPFPAASARTEYVAGEQITLTDERHGAFVRVLGPAGTQGWVEADALAPLAAPERGPS